MTCATSTHEARHPKPLLWNNTEGYSGEGGGRGLRTRGHTHACGEFISMHGKNHHNTVE